MNLVRNNVGNRNPRVTSELCIIDITHTNKQNWRVYTVSNTIIRNSFKTAKYLILLLEMALEQ